MEGGSGRQCAHLCERGHRRRTKGRLHPYTPSPEPRAFTLQPRPTGLGREACAFSHGNGAWKDAADSRKESRITLSRERGTATLLALAADPWEPQLPAFLGMVRTAFDEVGLLLLPQTYLSDAL